MSASIDLLWLLLCAGLVFVMQAGFLCLESGLTRSKNSINVAAKNLSDFAVAGLLFWLVGFGLMFGPSVQGWIGNGLFGLLDQLPAEPRLLGFVLFQIMFCATAATIVSGAVAERMRFGAYLALSAWVSLLVYPVFGHWAWGGAWESGPRGWLAELGFVDFAGSTVVHSVGGWVALVAVWRIGARRGRFPDDGPPPVIPAGNLPLAMLGALLLFFGWLGFNGGSTLAFDGRVPPILLHTTLAACAGALAGLAMGRLRHGYYEVMYLINGLIAGLVAITAGAHALSPGASILTGAIGALVMTWANEALLRRRIDDAVGAIPAHLAAGIWGTLAVGLLGDTALLGTGLPRLQQVAVQVLGVVVCGLWCVLATLAFVWLVRERDLRVSPDEERGGLNVAEHGARTELLELLEAMDSQRRSGDLSRRVPEEDFTEVGQIAKAYNRVIAALQAATARTLALLREMRDGVLTYRADGTLLGLNPGAEKLLGLRAEAVLGQPLPEVLRQAGHAQPVDPRRLTRVGATLELRMARPGAPRTTYELTVDTFHEGQDELYAAVLRDISDRKQVEQQLQRERDLAQVTLASIGDGVITTDEAGIVQYLNPVAERLTGWPAHQARGQPVTTVFRLLDADSGEPLPNPVRELLRGAAALARREHALLLRRDGERVPVIDTAAPIRTREGFLIGTVLVFHDVTVTLNLARELSHQASHDALTGVPNRREFERRLNELLARPDPATHVLCFLDLDQFKIVNDTCGHVAGDELLRQVTQLIRQQLRASDTLARLGGDEFGLILMGCSVEHALPLAQRIREAIADFRFGWGERSFAIGVSIGLVPIGPHDRDASALMATADAACYAAKESGRNRVHVYQPDDRRLLEQQGQMQWVSRLQAALDEDRLRLHAQPIVPLHPQADEWVHYEILVRLEEDGKLIQPGAFLPAAERYGLMPRIDQWVVRNTLAWLGDWVRQHGAAAATFAINVSGASLSDERFRQDLQTLLEAMRLPAGTLCFEITETAAIANLSTVVHFIHEVKRQGCLFALDDFGSGLSSFAYLKSLPVDFLKIDGSFVKDIETDPIDLAMVQAINAIGHVMGLRTIAEYVSSEPIRQRLIELGVDYAQGYHVGMPQPLDSLMTVRRMPR
ncbi:ammonium transporter [Tepidimonas sp.]|uniref:ammonium transporter n=1 Tax=Tepidimonas sp. TaxID=2002775 RepID=UPI002FE355A4